jgi:uncharacterized protein YpmB
MKRYFTSLLLFCVIWGIAGCSQGVKVGPELLSEPETRGVVKGQIAHIDSISLSTAGPIYRLVMGRDQDGRSKAIWVSKEIVYWIFMDQGITKDKALQLGKEKDLEGIYKTQLVYIPKLIESNDGLQEGVYWWIKGKGKTLFISFKNGEIALETKNDNSP